MTENSLFKGVRNYNQKLSGKFDNSVAWNSSRYGRFLASLIALWQLQKCEKRGLQLRVRESAEKVNT